MHGVIDKKDVILSLSLSLSLEIDFSAENVVNRFLFFIEYDGEGGGKRERKRERRDDGHGLDAIYHEILPTLKLQTYTGPTSISSIVTCEQCRLLNCKWRAGIEMKRALVCTRACYACTRSAVSCCSLIPLHYAAFIACFPPLKYRNVVFVRSSEKQRCKVRLGSIIHAPVTRR